MSKSRILNFYKTTEKAQKVWYSFSKEELFEDSEEVTQVMVLPKMSTGPEKLLLINTDYANNAAYLFKINEGSVNFEVTSVPHEQLKSLAIEYNYDQRILLVPREEPKVEPTPLWLIIGLVSGGVALIAIIVLVSVYLVRRVRKVGSNFFNEGKNRLTFRR